MHSEQGPMSTEQSADFRAKERNHYLSFWEKHFKNKAVDAGDILYDEAVAMDNKLEAIVKDGEAKNYTEAMSLVSKDKKFANKDEYQIYMEELARAAALKFAQDIQLNNFKEEDYFKSYVEARDDAETSPFKQKFDKEFSPDGYFAMTGVEIMNHVMPLLSEYQKEILQKKVEELTEQNDTQRLEELHSNHYFAELLK